MLGGRGVGGRSGPNRCMSEPRPIAALSPPSCRGAGPTSVAANPIAVSFVGPGEQVVRVRVVGGGGLAKSLRAAEGQEVAFAALSLPWRRCAHLCHRQPTHRVLHWASERVSGVRGVGGLSEQSRYAWLRGEARPSPRSRPSVSRCDAHLRRRQPTRRALQWVGGWVLGARSVGGWSRQSRCARLRDKERPAAASSRRGAHLRRRQPTHRALDWAGWWMPGVRGVGGLSGQNRCARLRGEARPIGAFTLQSTQRPPPALPPNQRGLDRAGCRS
eukprot:6200655-Pleurochrysis_carterae.AAC.2